MDHLLRVSRLYMLCPMFKIAGSGHILHWVASLSKSVTIWYVHGVTSCLHPLSYRHLHGVTSCLHPLSYRHLHGVAS